MRNIILLIALLFAGIAQAQLYPFHSNYKMEKSPKSIERDATDQPYYYNKYLYAIEYEYSYYDRTFYKYHTEHYIVKLNTNAAIEEFNKIYIPMEDVALVFNIEARIIRADDLIEVDIEMEEFYSEDEEEKYNYFAVGGLELGDELEIMYTKKMAPEFNGDQFHFQGEMPIYNFDFRFIVPNDSYFDFLAHNGLPTPILVDTILQRHQYDIHLDTIPAFKAEYFSEYKNTTMKLDASLKEEGDFGAKYSPFQVFTDYINTVFNVSLTPQDKKSLKKLNEAIGVSTSNSEKDNIRKIENYMKNEFLIGYGKSGQSIPQMIKTGKSKGLGALKLIMAMLKQANIEYEYGLVSDRYDTRFSPKIESNYFLQNYFIYFPACDSYLAPLDFSTRLDYLDDEWIPNHGLFLKAKPYGVPKTEFDVRPINGTASNQNTDSTIITINVNADLTDAKISIERHITGYDAGEHQVYYYLYSEARKKEMYDDLLNVFKDNSQFKMTEVDNVAVEDSFLNPLIIKGECTFLYVPLFEKAGDKTIFKLGEIFGEFIDPVEVEKKKSDFTFSHAFIRSIEVRVNFQKDVQIANTETVPTFKNLVDTDEIKVSSELSVKSNQIIYKVRDEYFSNEYSIDLKEEIMEIFHFHNDLGKINLIIE